MVAGLALSQVTIRSDMAEFLPRGDTSAARLVAKELLSGAATSLIMLGVEGAPTDVLARVSQSMTRALDRTGLFSVINNGSQDLLVNDAQRVLFSHRYSCPPSRRRTLLQSPPYAGTWRRCCRVCNPQPHRW